MNVSILVNNTVLKALKLEFRKKKVGLIVGLGRVCNEVLMNFLTMVVIEARFLHCLVIGNETSC